MRETMIDDVQSIIGSEPLFNNGILNRDLISRCCNGPVIAKSFGLDVHREYLFHVSDFKFGILTAIRRRSASPTIVNSTIFVGSLGIRSSQSAVGKYA